MNDINKLINECLNCKNPTCINGCPIYNNIPRFIELAKLGLFDEALKEINKTSTLPSICSLVCPSENQCKGHCVKNKINNPVKINEIEQYITLKANQPIPTINKNNYKVAIVGSGPAGLACAEKLTLKGYNVDVYDKYDIPGGILTYGIPDFVLNKGIVNKKIDYLKQLGINFKMNLELTKDIFLRDLSNNYDAVFLAFGASISKTMDIEGNKLNNIIDANYFLERMYKKQYSLFNNIKNVVVVGGGNTAIDAARVAKRNLNCNVNIVYRRSVKEMPARYDEYQNALKDGINFMFLTNPIRFIGNHNVSEIECIKMELIQSANERAKPVEIKDSNFKIQTDLVILALSSIIDSNLTTNLNTNKYGCIEVNEKLQTSIDSVFAGGDCVSGPSLVVTAMKDGIKAANEIDFYIQNKK